MKQIHTYALIISREKKEGSGANRNLLSDLPAKIST